jgi:hypothetical protein
MKEKVMTKTQIDLQRLIELCSERCRKLGKHRDFTTARYYAEPGYSQPESGIVFGNWNAACGFNVPKEVQKRDPVSKLARVLEHFGFELEWEDEWTTCYDCGKAVRTQANSYSWTGHYRIMNECEVVCLDCLNWEDYLESIEDDPKTCCPPDINPLEFGYVKHNGTFESGFYPGQTDDPNKIMKEMQAIGMAHIVFRQSEQSQFYIRFEAYYKPQDNS